MTSSLRFESEPGVLPTPLGRPLTLPVSGRTVPNRILKAALSEGLATFDATNLAERGIPTPELIRVYERWGEGGWGQILTGNTMIDPAHLEQPGNLVIPPEAPFSGPRFDGFAKIAEGAKRHGSLVLCQVSHAGRQTPEMIQPNPLSASDVQLFGAATGFQYAKPRPVTVDEIKGIVEGFAHAAEFLSRAGFDGIQVHAAHGYLLAQFLSRTMNRRTDAYGGDDKLENRARIITEIASAVRARVARKDFVMSIKINCVEFMEGGFSPEEAVELGRILEGAGFDWVETSGGTYEDGGFVKPKESTIRRESFFVVFAEQIARVLERTPVFTTGGLKTVGGMVRTLEALEGVNSGSNSTGGGVGLGRAATQEPQFAKNVLEGKITGAMRYDLGDFDFTRNLVSYQQIHQMSRGEEPADLGEPAMIKALLAKFPPGLIG